MEAVVNQFVKDWFAAVEGEIPASISRLVAEMDRTMDPEKFLNSIQAFIQLQQLVAGISLTLTEIAAGHGAQRLREGLDLLDKGVDRARRDFSAALTVGMGDLVELNRAAQAVHQAVIQRYQTETQLATELYQRVNQLRQAAQDWEMGLLERLQDPAALRDALSGHYRELAGKLLGTDDPARRLALLEEGLATLDQWLEASLQALTEQQQLIQAAADERIKALQDELQLAQAWTGVLNQARALLERLTLTAASPLPGSARLGIAQGEVERLRAAYGAATGEERARLGQELLAALATQLEMTQGLHQRPSPEYLEAYNAIVAEVAALEATAQSEGERALSLQNQIKDIQTETAHLLDALNQQMDARRAEAAEHYRIMLTEGQRLYALLESQAQVELAAVLQGLSYEQFMAARQAEMVTLLTQIRDGIRGALPEGSFAGGIDYISRPMNATLHTGERVLTAEENRRYGQGASITIAPQITIQSGGDPKATAEAVKRAVVEMIPVIKQRLRTA